MIEQLKEQHAKFKFAREALELERPKTIRIQSFDGDVESQPIYTSLGYEPGQQHVYIESRDSSIGISGSFYCSLKELPKLETMIGSFLRGSRDSLPEGIYLKEERNA